MPKKDEINININNMPFTDQKDFMEALTKTLFDNNEIDLDMSRRDVEVTKDAIIKAIKKSLVSEHEIDRYKNDFTIPNLLEISRNHINNILNMIKTNKMAENIQTIDNGYNTPEYKAFHLNTLESYLFRKINELNEKDRKEILNIKISDKDIINNYADTFNRDSVVSYFSGLGNRLFHQVYIVPEDHDYLDEEGSLKRRAHPALDEIEKQEKFNPLEFNSKEGIVNEENVIQYAKELKAFKDMMNKKPWYIRWFSSDYKNIMRNFENCKVLLYNRGISKDSLNKFLKSDGLEAAQDKLFKTNLVNINKYNEKNLPYLESLEDAQKDIYLKNFNKEMKYNKLANKTLDKVVDIKDNIEIDDSVFNDARNERLKNKALFNGYETDPTLNRQLKEQAKEYLKDMDEEIDLINKLEKESKNKVSVTEEDDLVFNPKDIMDSSSGLDLDLNDDLLEEELDAFKK